MKKGINTIREWLEAAGFDFDNGKIIVHLTRNDDDEEYVGSSPGWDEAVKATETPEEVADVISKEFDSGYGGPKCPRFIAEDGDKIYFPAQYDGSTWLEFVYKDIDKYMNIENETPYPGG